jgi:hypothetical protein
VARVAAGIIGAETSRCRREAVEPTLDDFRTEPIIALYVIDLEPDSDFRSTGPEIIAL